MAKFCIDPGHGGSDSGGVGGKRKEKSDVLRLAIQVGQQLEKQGHTVLLTRSVDEFVKIAQRTAEANRAKCDYFLSIHRNTGPATAHGLEIWVHNRATARTVQQAKDILDACVKVHGTNRGVKKGAASPDYENYGVNSQTTMASALLEMLFITNTEDNKAFDRYLDDYALAIAKGLVKAVGGQWKPISDDAPIRVGDTVSIRPGAVYGGLASTRGSKVPAYVTQRHYQIKQLATHKGTPEALLEGINSWVSLAFLRKV